VTTDPTIDVSVVILFDGPLMLINKRPEGSYFGGWWEWPGGKQNPGETALECARRELIEEIGFDAPDLAQYSQAEVDYPGRRVRLTFFVGRKPEGASASAGALEHRWLPPSDARKLQFLEPNLPVLEQIITNPPFERI
jgi:mutator protein MutT